MSGQPRTWFRVYFRRRGGQWLDDNRNIMLVQGKDELERILGRKTPIAVAWEKAKLYKCSCGRRGPWEKGWAWRGSWGSMIEGERIDDISCSAECRERQPARQDEFGRALHWIRYEPLNARDRAKRQTVGMTETERQALTRERRTVPLPEPWLGAGTCRWCLGKIVHKRAKQMNWHPDCKRIWLLHYDRDVQARFLIERDGFDCWDCKRGGRWHWVDTRLLKYGWELWPLCLPPARFDWNDRYPDAGKKIDGVIVGLVCEVRYKPHCGGLEVDHEIPLWSIWHLPDEERKPYYGPTNIRLRCDRCHKAKSKREAAARAALRKKGPIELV